MAALIDRLERQAASLRRLGLDCVGCDEGCIAISEITGRRVELHSEETRMVL